MLLFKNRQNGRELHTNPWTFSHKGKHFFSIHTGTQLLLLKKKKNQSRWGVFVLCMSEYLPGWGWQLGSSFFQSAFVDAAPAPSGQSLNLGCPMWRKQRHTLSLNLKKIHHGEKSACSYLCNMYRLFWRNTESVMSHCATMFYSQLAGQKRRSPAEQNTPIITALSTSVGSCHRSQWL